MSDSIQRSVQINAAPERVWEALIDYRQFGEWFQVDLKSPFVAGQPTTGTIMFRERPMDFEFHVEAIRPKTYFAYRWHPYAVDPSVDYSGEEKTLVEFNLEAADGGTRLSVTESGFDRIPEHRRGEAMKMNTQGWSIQVERIRDYVEA